MAQVYSIPRFVPSLINRFLNDPCSDGVREPKQGLARRMAFYDRISDAIDAIRRGSESKITISGTVSLSGAVRLANALKGCKFVKTLSLNSCQLEDAHITVLCDGLESSSVQTLFLGTNSITAIGAIALGRLLNKQTCKVTNLSLFSNKLGNEGVAVLSNSFRNSQLHTLDLGANEISATGAIAVASGMRGSRIQDLYLKNNFLTDASMIAVSNGIEVNPNLQLIELSGNVDISDLSISALLRGIQGHCSMRSILLEYTLVSSQGNMRLASCIRRLHCNRAKLMTLLCAPGCVARLGKHSPLKLMPTDLIRALSSMLVFDDDKDLTG